MPDDLEIEYVTHASLLVRTPRVRLLTDPFYWLELDPFAAPSVRNFPPRELDPAAFGRLDYVFSSHEHHDHCHPETLAVLKERIGTVLLPAERPALAARYTGLGFRDIVFLENRRPMALAGGLEVTCYWDDPVDSTLLVTLDGVTLVHGNDCLLEPATLAEIARRGPVDYGFLCSTSTQQLFPLILPRPTAELEALSAAREAEFFEGQLARIAALRPRVVIPYSYTASYVEPDQLHLNGYGRLTPTLFAARLAERMPAQECWPLAPGDVVEAGARRVRPLRAGNPWGDSLAEFRDNLAAYARSLRGALPPFDAGDPADCDAALRERLAGRLASGVPHARFYAILDDAVVLRVVGRDRQLGYLVDLRRKLVEPALPGPGARPHGLEIEIPASLVRLMLDGAYDPFMILYTYKVKFRPQPMLARRALRADQEYLLYLGVLLTLFMDPANPVMADFAGLADYLGV